MTRDVARLEQARALVKEAARADTVDWGVDWNREGYNPLDLARFEGRVMSIPRYQARPLFYPFESAEPPLTDPYEWWCGGGDP